ncbi:MAG: endoglucanase A [Archangiaceae bacterium]|nr:endoglucanase A [Archangiaceae bacterium]
MPNLSLPALASFLCLSACVATVGPGGDGGGTSGTGGQGGTAGAGGQGGSAGGSSSTGGGTGTAGGSSSVNLDAPLTPGNPGTADVQLTVRSNVGRHSISALVYGTNQPGTNTGYTLRRMGGNRLTAFNWENSASNAGVDYMFQNDNRLSSSNTPGAAVTSVLDEARTAHAAALLTVPIVDYVAADKNGGGDVRNSGANYLMTRFKQNRAQKGAALSTTPDATDAFVNQDEFVAWVKANHGEVQTLFSLDNEPDLWTSTHPEVHPNGLTYVELVTRSLAYARAIKSVWPEAPVTGFVSYGWAGYVNLQNASDASGKGEFIDYFLDQVKAAEVADGHPLIEYLDLHWYPEAKGGGTRIIGNDTSTAGVAARVQAPRSLWDPTYSETSWVRDFVGGPIRLLPRLKDKIAAHKPGTKLAFTEWNYGGGNHISGAVAVADVLGIFGRDDVGLATYWKLNGAEPYADAAFAAFRNFDGALGHFGDTALDATSSNAATASIYASVDAANPARTVLVAINKDTASHTAALTLAHPVSYGSLKVYTLTSAGSALTAAAAVQANGTNAFLYTLPAMSVSVLVPQQ